MGSLSPHFQGPLPSSLGPNPLCYVGESWGSNAYTHLHIEWDTQMFNAEIPVIVFGVESPKEVQNPEHNKNFRTDVEFAFANKHQSPFQPKTLIVRKKNVEILKSLTTQSHDFVHSPPKTQSGNYINSVL